MNNHVKVPHQFPSHPDPPNLSQSYCIRKQPRLHSQNALNDCELLSTASKIPHKVKPLPLQSSKKHSPSNNCRLNTEKSLYEHHDYHSPKSSNKQSLPSFTGLSPALYELDPERNRRKMPSGLSGLRGMDGMIAHKIRKSAQLRGQSVLFHGCSQIDGVSFMVKMSLNNNRFILAGSNPYTSLVFQLQQQHFYELYQNVLERNPCNIFKYLKIEKDRLVLRFTMPKNNKPQSYYKAHNQQKAHNYSKNSLKLPPI